MKKILVSVTTLSALALAASTQAAVIFNNAFTTAGDTGGWVASRSSSTVANASGALVLSTTSSASEERILGKGFASQTLATNGDILRLTFSYRQSGAIDVIRVGLFNLATVPTLNDWNKLTPSPGIASGTNSYTGYWSFIRDNSSVASDARRSATGYSTSATAPTLVTTSLNIGATPGLYNYATDDSKTYNITFDVKRVSATSSETRLTMVDTATPFASYTVTGLDNTGQYKTFNSVFVAPTGSTAIGTSTLDNTRLEYIVIPEPASLALIGLGAMGLLGRRRRVR